MESSQPLSEIAGKAEAADVALGRKLATSSDEPLAQVADKVGKLGDQEPLYAMAGILIAGGIVCRNLRLARAGVAMFAGVAAADAGKSAAKRLVRRTRPHVLRDEGRYESDVGGSDQKPEQSFPSGHVAGCVAAARALSRSYPNAGPALGAAAGVMGLARLVKGAHWPLDVVAGALIGWAGEAATERLLRGIGLRPAR